MKRILLIVMVLFAVPVHAETSCYENDTGSWCCEDGGLQDAVLVLEKDTGWLIAVHSCQNGRNFDLHDYVAVNGVDKDRVWELVDATRPQFRINEETQDREWFDEKTSTWLLIKKWPPYPVKLPDVTTTDSTQLNSIAVTKNGKESILLNRMVDGVTSITENTKTETR